MQVVNCPFRLSRCPCRPNLEMISETTLKLALQQDCLHLNGLYLMKIYWQLSVRNAPLLISKCCYQTVPPTRCGHISDEMRRGIWIPTSPTNVPDSRSNCTPSLSALMTENSDERRCEDAASLNTISYSYNIPQQHQLSTSITKPPLSLNLHSTCI